ncbi:MAG: hypothetical protein K6B14_06330 [Lachnospiraceae bacterium]|nr:hypothetical protein [Lachnospiraceae bacterium]
MKKTYKEIIKEFFQKLLVLSAVPAVLIATASFLLLPLLVALFDFSIIHVLAGIYCVYGIAVIIINRHAIYVWLTPIGHFFRDHIPIIPKLMKDKAFRQRCFIYWNTFISFLMVVFYVITGYHYRSKWFEALAGYNFIIMMIRGNLSYRVFAFKKKGFTGKKLYRREWVAFRDCGIMILILNIVINVMSIQMTFENQYFPYHPALIMSIAAFALYRFVTGFMNLKKYKGDPNLVLFASKNVDFVIGWMAMYTLQTTLLSLLPENSPHRFWANMFTGNIVILIAVVIAARMIYSSAKTIRRIDRDEIAEEELKSYKV